MDKATTAETPATALAPLDHHENDLHAGHANVSEAARALSQQVNEIGMTGFAGGVQRIAIVAGEGLRQAPQGMVDTVKKEGVGGLAVTAVESAAMGFGLRVLMQTPGARVAQVAALGLGTAFLAKNAADFGDALSRGANAHTWKEMDEASHRFGQAAGSLAVDSLVGVAGYHVGSAFGPRPIASLALEPTRAARSLHSESLPNDVANPELLKSIRSVKDGPASVADAADVADKPIVKSVVSPEHTLSMRELAEKGDPRFDKIMENYYGQLQKAFPDASEIESMQTYKDYLHDKDFAWDMLVLNDKHGNVMGGIQSQVVDVGGKEINKAVWAEHIWLAPEARTFQNFQTLLKTGQERWTATGSDVVFMEFNDRAKMTWQQQVDDASAGLSPEARERIWGRVGLYVLGDETGRIAPYAQPAMGDGAPVTYLSVGMAPLKSKTLDGQSIPISDYEKLLKAAHATIPDLNPETDPTVVKYVSELADIAATGQERLSFARLKDTHVLRLIQQRFIGTKPTMD
jgi:hypothetical protein